MKRKHRIIFMLAITVMLTLAFSTTAFAISESDVQAQVDASSRETVSGNVFIWFLCAIAFLKVSQKIDSFMSSLGINVGHTGGSMLAEAMIATRGITDGKKLFGGGGFAGFGGRGSRGASGTSGTSGADGASGGFMSGGLAGVVSRNINRSAAQTATGQGGGIVGGTAFNSSLEKGGDFANNVIGSVAKGSVSSTGTMKGEQAAKGLASYLGYGVQGGQQGASGFSAAPSPGVTSSPSAPGVTSLPSSPDASSEPFSPGISSESFAPDFSSEPFAPGMSPEFSPGISSPGISPEPSDMSSEAPAFSNVEIGGGRITGSETTAENPGGIQFGMYHTDQYMAPEGKHSIVETVDGANWYKQYATDTVEKTPYMAPDGSIAYNESIVKKLPKMPQRKDRV